MSNKNDRDQNYISVGSWMLMMLITALPCIGVVMIVIWAFIGENESRKNYYRALLAWFGIGVVLFVILVVLGQMPQLQKHLNDALPKQ